jgi:hypothetical protein
MNPRARHCGDENKPLPLPEIESQFFGNSAHSLVIIPTEVSWPLSCIDGL